MITYQKETFAALSQEAEELFKKHYEESADHLDRFPLAMNLKAYLTLESKHRLETYTVRDGNKLIGYSVWMLIRPIHYSHNEVASSALIYLLPEYRKGLEGYKFIKWSIEHLKQREVERILVSIKANNDFGNILKRLGASDYEKVYSIVLD
ncbi:hypothetical protein UFOVP118_58 [uncultured Caudovirales phage]|uniref:N-acetyltransferase domain-containing protein n=1 Tax=uncultured Caudovirales phage TaxID=2100421 RepID=A0A6J5L8T3_9CAUD|nr:hypothetical protein UFOVP118_58 [uncultured Caudovirales phage]